VFELCECSARIGLPIEHSSWLVIAGSRDLGGVAVPVAARVVDPVDGGGGGDPEQVGKDSGGELSGEVG
jgi:hypothetical protein